MKSHITFILLIFIYCTTHAQTAESYLEMADSAFEAHKEDKAKELYLRAADMGNIEAHFQLYYKYNMDDHLYIAAKAGHSKALSYYLEGLFFRAGSLTQADPQKAYDMYLEALEKNPQVDVWGINTLKQCVEAGPFDVAGFMKIYHLTEESLNGWYGVWELASEASSGGRFGQPDPLLVLQLVCRGGSVPAEDEMAVDFAYTNWKNNEVQLFKVCDYITSGIGLAYCARKEADEAESENELRIDTLSQILPNNAGVSLKTAYKIASEFFEAKAVNEEGYGGTARSAFIIGSVMQQKDAYLDLLRRLGRDSMPDSFYTAPNADKDLNIAYQKILKSLKDKTITDWGMEISDSSVINTEKLWIPYRDASAHIFSVIMPRVDEANWRNWLTLIRINQLNHIGEPSD